MLKQFTLAALISLSLAFPSLAALKIGEKAPDFSVKAATNGVVSDFSLSQALKSGPVIVYFYPKAFTSGCSLEARQFSENIGNFKAKKISVVGLSADDVPLLQKFSKADCGGKFPVGSDPKAKIAAKYKAKMPAVDMASRISYIIGRDGKVAFVHNSGNAATHVPALLAAASKLR
jgi:thioredoxin-dependent peroxiredoxin